MEREAQSSLHRPAAVGALVDATAKPLPLGSVEAGVAAGDPARQVSSQGSPVEVLCDRSLADSLAVVALVVMELLQDRVYLELRHRRIGACIHEQIKRRITTFTSVLYQFYTLLLLLY